MSLMERNENGIPEDLARFYTAELILALNAVHTLGYIHQNIKPSNMLIDDHKHLKLAGFGVCVKMDEVSLLVYHKLFFCTGW